MDANSDNKHVGASIGDQLTNDSELKAMLERAMPARSAEQTGEQAIEEGEQREPAVPARLPDRQAGRQESPPEGQPKAEEKWDAKAWERFGHRWVSAAAMGNKLPGLPDGVSLDDAPEPIRRLLAGPEESEELEAGGGEAEPGLEIEEEALDWARYDDEYQLALYKAMRDAESDEEMAEAVREVKATFADRHTDQALDLLRLAGYALPDHDPDALDAALAKIPGLVLPNDAADPAQTRAFLLSVRRHIGTLRETSPSDAAIEKARQEGREQALEELKRLAAAQSVERGDLVSAAGSASAAGSFSLENASLEELLAEERRRLQARRR